MTNRPTKLVTRFRFQLAPLVDLLLIVVFAQFMELRETASREALAEQSQVETLRQERDQLAVAFAEVAQRSEQQTQRTTRAIASIAAAFRVDSLSESELQALVGDELEDLAPVVEEVAHRVSQASPEEVVRFLIGHAELLKRAEIWQLHADADRRIMLTTGEEIVTIKLERRGQDDRTVELEDQLFAAYKQLPQPKGLVVILVSYSPDAIAGVYQPMIDGMPKSVERMRTDLPATRFEYTVLGTTSLPDALKSSTLEISE